MMGGSESYDFLAPSGSGENTLVTCENGDYAADIEIARAIPRAPDVSGAARRTGGDRDARRRRRSRRSPSSSASTRRRRRRRCRYTKDDGTVVLALVRGDDRLEEAKLLAALGADVRPATEDEIRAAFGAEPRLARPGRLRRRGDRRRDAARRASSSPARTATAGISAASRHGRDFQARVRRHPRAEARATAARTAAARCSSRPRSRSATSSSSAPSTPRRSARRSSTRTGRRSRSSWARYGIGPGRVMAAVVEQHHDEHGIVWPRRSRPYDVHVVALTGRGGDAREAAAQALSTRRLDVLLDDRDARPGEKFADADLIGCPIRVTAGQEEPRGREGRRPRPRDGRGARGWTSPSSARSAEWRAGGDSARSPSGRRSSADGRDGRHVPRARGARPGSPPAISTTSCTATGRCRRTTSSATLAEALGVEAEHFREFRLRSITERLEAMPELIDRLYKRLGD